MECIFYISSASTTRTSNARNATVGKALIQTFTLEDQERFQSGDTLVEEEASSIITLNHLELISRPGSIHSVLSIMPYKDVPSWVFTQRNGQYITSKSKKACLTLPSSHIPHDQSIKSETFMLISCSLLGEIT